MSKPSSSKQREGSIFTGFIKPVGDIPDQKWRDLIEEQDHDTLIFDIREELIKQVTDECFRKHIKRELYKFLVECTHNAYQQIIPLHFYKYDASYKIASSQQSWIADEEPVICKPDSWAQGNIPYNVDDIPTDEYQQTSNIFSDYELVKCTEYPSSHVFDTVSYTVEPDAVDLENSSSNEDVLEMEEPEPNSQYTVQFTNYEGNLSTEVASSIQDITTQQNSAVSENMFYKIMKANKTSNLSLQMHSVRYKKIIPPPVWTNIDEIKDELKPRAYSANRVHVPSYVKKQVPQLFLPLCKIDEQRK